ncbi:MAG: hypothetical protein ACXWMO_07295 [Syntrophales bacterium]
MSRSKADVCTFTAMGHETETGLYFCRRRYYDRGTGRSRYRTPGASINFCMKKHLKIITVFIVITGILIAFSCGDNKVSRPWGISDETISAIVKTKLGCDAINVIVNNVGTPETTCDQLGDCIDYADIMLTTEGVCGGRSINGSCVLRLYKSKLGNYRGEMIGGSG